MLGPRAAVRRDAEVLCFARLVQLFKGFDYDFDVGVRVGSIHLGLDAPDVEVIGPDVAQTFFDVVNLCRDVAVFIASRTQLGIVGADNHSLPASL